MKYKSLVAVLLLLLFTGCGSKYKYHVDPTPIKAGESKYYLEDVKVLLTFGFKNPKDGDFENQDQLTESFRKAIIKHMNEKNLLSENKDNSEYFLKIFVNYKRTFNFANNLSIPVVWFSFDVFNKEGVKLASFHEQSFKPSYGTFGDMAVAAKIVSNNWGREGELKDVNLISKIIVNDLIDLGN